MINRDDINENIVIIKINQRYSPDMSALELYEATRGVWKRKIESVEIADYCLSVYKWTVVEVYRIYGWYPAGTTEYKTREINKEDSAGRIEFEGTLAPDIIRNAYIGKSVKNLYKWGEANPVKVFTANVDINTARYPVKVMEIGEKKFFVCPRCKEDFLEAPRCPVCGQLIKHKGSEL